VTQHKSLSGWLTLLGWGLILLDGLLIFFVPESALTTLPRGFVFVGWLILTSLLAVSWLTFAYRSHFQSWLGWIFSLSLMVISFFFTMGITLQIPSRLSLFFAILVFPASWLLFLSTIILLWHRDVGLLFLSWIPVLYVWSAFLAWRYQGNLIELWLSNLNQADGSSPLWWFSTLFCLSSCVLPIAVISFLGHTVRLLVREFRQD